jgi:hypothetical protein
VIWNCLFNRETGGEVSAGHRIADLALNVGLAADCLLKLQCWLPAIGDGHASRAVVKLERWMYTREHEAGKVCVAMMAMKKWGEN